MNFSLEKGVKHILILGAGASVDYGLPVWKNLGSLIAEKIKNNAKNTYQYKKEILEWLEKVGDKKDYDTIDKCIKSESVSVEYPDGDEIENELFSVMENIFNELYKENSSGWIRILNEKILDNKSDDLEHKLAFVNFNYDDVLEKNFLDFSYLHKKQRRYNYRPRLEELSNVVVTALYPHGKFSEEQKPESHIKVSKDTMKSYEGVHLDVVSCYESQTHKVYNPQIDSLELYLMGLGSGLEINLNNIDFTYNNVSKVYVTIKDPSKKDGILKFLNDKYKKSEINVFSSCMDLVKQCFND